MRLTPPPLQIGDRDGFKGTDIFDYQRFGANLATLVENLEGPSVIALDGGWGSGKTIFAKQWAGLLRQRGSAVIYFDAFAADAGQDPLFDLASQLFEAAPEGKPRREWAESAAVLAKRLGPVVVGLWLRFATSGLIGEDEVKESVAGIADAKEAGREGGAEVSEAFRRRIEGAQDRVRVLSDFRRKLTALAGTMQTNALAEAEDVSEDRKLRPVVMIVDELDRCKPTYALDLLENIKHVFDVGNVCFVLVTNSEQLEGVVARQYGTKDARQYMEKFVHAAFRLPMTSRSMRDSSNSKYISSLCGSMLGEGKDWMGSFTLEALVQSTSVSLRGIERILRSVAICHSHGVFHLFMSSGKGKEAFQELSIPMTVCVLHALKQDMYGRLRSRQVSGAEILELLKVERWDRPDLREAYAQRLLEVFPPSDDEGRSKWDSAVYREHVSEVCGFLDDVVMRESRSWR